MRPSLWAVLLLSGVPGRARCFRVPSAPQTLATAVPLRMQADGGTMAAGRAALVTGSTDGIGQHTAERLAQDGWEVLIHGRNPKRIAATLEKIRQKAPAARLHAFQADFASFSDVRRLAAEVSNTVTKLDLLVNNAGVYEEGMQTTADGNEFVFQVNVLSPFLLTTLLLPTVSKAPEPRIIITSSISQSGSLDWENLQMEKGFSSHGSYSSSKLCNAMHAMELSERLKASSKHQHITVNSLDPGTVNTKMLLAGWGRCGIDVESANNQYQLGTSPAWKGKTGVYTCGNRESSASQPCYDPTQRLRLWEIMERLTHSTCP